MGSQHILGKWDSQIVLKAGQGQVRGLSERPYHFLTVAVAS